MIISQILFLILLVWVFKEAVKRYGKVIRNIRLGRNDEPLNNKGGFRRMLLVAFGQQKMFKRPLPAILHLFIYVAFIITQFDLLEQIIDGITGSHRILSHYLGGLYSFMISFIELLSVFAFIATIAFLSRRNLLRIPRFTSKDLAGWARIDANLILIGEILLLTGIFCLNGADKALETKFPNEYPSTGFFLITGWLGPLLFGGMPEFFLHVISGFGWWLHVLVVFGFILYLPGSKHLHILLAFPNTYLSSDNPRGRMINIESIENEVKNMMEIPLNHAPKETLADFGVHDIFQLTQKNLLDAYSCTECGRCTAVCPANLTGKKLSPRKIMMNVRDRMEEVGCKLDDPNFSSMNGEIDNKIGFNDGRDLFNYIEKEEIRACTTCNACVEACPVLINPLEIILQLRRYEILTQSSGPPDWVPMYTALENNGSPWQMTIERDDWIKELN
ncbi:MAG TPA: (Fe-S)-binding protein [Saprospiraceae bacterium]|jgi:heterodisulfide reductase subunit C|nr:(Fe-S)-binding protein [Saprospiraceae bacterium]HMY85618.1 (Fe-S)-binding protein [Saprospiraceae bacterium]HMZ24622.1 (Fe-S)-binding protein [Saprospiraceae bacterium]HNA77542.1 (Fe-S)-binding protein [Saprospiraceae bacterium]HNB92451.1 (Fe-S)-binding protein [Saprospiraceae bacterium]